MHSAGKLIIAILIVYSAFWVAFIFYSPYSEPSEFQLAELSKATTAAQGALYLTFPYDDIKQVRIIPKGGGNVEIYIAKYDFESIPFPEREAFVDSIGKAWCSELDSLAFMPAVKIRDIRSGDNLASYSCSWNALLR